ncbi:MAG TPA: GNAT family N-acetyltransferase [Longimicrobiaceae bacterium]|nr:GNAT family N-acetyltransferase [Longimicrobiaceae bacterium]
MSLRPIRPEDEEFLCRLYASTREEELAPVPWTTEQKGAFLRQQFQAQHAYWHEHYTGASFDLVLLDGAPIGRLYVDRWPREIRIVDVSLLPEHRNGGIGTALIRQVFAEGDRDGKPVSIHVEAFNPARRLYGRLGFDLVEDKGVYVLMARPPATGALTVA